MFHVEHYGKKLASMIGFLSDKHVGWPKAIQTEMFHVEH